MTLLSKGGLKVAEFKDIRLGTTPISKIYAGTDLVFEKVAADTTAPTTTVYPDASKTYEAGQRVWFEVNEACLTYYTLDGSTPTTNSPIFQDTFTLEETTTLKYFSVDKAGNTEAVKTTVFNIAAAQPAGWRYFRITPDSMNGHWQAKEIRIFDAGFTNRALAASGSFTPAADSNSTFGTWAGLKDEDITTNSVYWTWGYPLEINVDLGAEFEIVQLDIFLGTGTTNPTTAASIQVSKNNVDWVDGKASYTGNPATNLQRYTVTA
jgi:hypothetical protein